MMVMECARGSKACPSNPTAAATTGGRMGASPTPAGKSPVTSASALERLAAAPASLGAVDPQAYATVTADAVSQQFAVVFEQACR